jgi:hypothetical protein
MATVRRIAVVGAGLACARAEKMLVVETAAAAA